VLPFLEKFSSLLIVDLCFRPIVCYKKCTVAIQNMRDALDDALDATCLIGFLVFLLFRCKIITFSQSKYRFTCIVYTKSF